MSAQTDAANSQIADAAISPIQATVNGQSVTDRTADDMLKLRNDVAAREAIAAGRSPFSFMGRSKIVPPGGG